MVMKWIQVYDESVGGEGLAIDATNMLLSLIEEEIPVEYQATVQAEWYVEDEGDDAHVRLKLGYFREETEEEEVERIARSVAHRERMEAFLNRGRIRVEVNMEGVEIEVKKPSRGIL